MIQAVFIADLHLHPQRPDIQRRFECFITWALTSTQSVYILGDFLHAWAGDDLQDAWSSNIARTLLRLKQHGIQTYYMHGNRDFLLGEAFAQQAGLVMLPDPTVIQLHATPILLSHGDRYCTRDQSHQWLRRCTRNRVFKRFFLSLPCAYRRRIVAAMRHRSMHAQKSSSNLAVTPAACLRHLRQNQAKILVHGHTHQPGLSEYTTKANSYQRYVLSDWDDHPVILCYNKAKGFYFERIFWGI